MFLVTDLSGKFPYTAKLYDTKDVGDVVVGITGDQADGDLAETMAGYMSFGNEFVSRGRFKLLCIQEEDMESCEVDASTVRHFAPAERMTEIANNAVDAFGELLNGRSLYDALSGSLKMSDDEILAAGFSSLKEFMQVNEEGE